MKIISSIILLLCAVQAMHGMDFNYNVFRCTSPVTTHVFEPINPAKPQIQLMQEKTSEHIHRNNDCARPDALVNFTDNNLKPIDEIVNNRAGNNLVQELAAIIKKGPLPAGAIEQTESFDIKKPSVLIHAVLPN